MDRYVLGFGFTEPTRSAGTGVILIKKKRPDWQAGLLNGVGGKIEKDESPYQAMRREFREETGEWVRGWIRFAILTWRHSHNRPVKSEMHVFAAYDLRNTVSTMTDESVDIYPTTSLDSLRLVDNNRWLVPMALESRLHNVKASIDYVS